ncbi:hypothetical protein [Kordiimonas lipolytica]|uniref:hypothetical protein n=1 Tax=Kordiimonas lipolytica TaxID=1662421 RepID=UPI001E413B02|nr:hypothetical protein [Kordiimonas lipolytica]
MYVVRWRFSKDQFIALAAYFLEVSPNDYGADFCRWHQQEVRSLARDADQETLDEIEAHYRRSNGRVDLRPAENPNPIYIEELLAGQV